MDDESPIPEIWKDLGLPVKLDPAGYTLEFLVEEINKLLNSDFPRLVNILYRMDISEEKLRLLLRGHPGTDAAQMIAALMIERHLQKIKARKEPRREDENIDENEKW